MKKFQSYLEDVIVENTLQNYFEGGELRKEILNALTPVSGTVFKDKGEIEPLVTKLTLADSIKKRLLRFLNDLFDKLALVGVQLSVSKVRALLTT